MAGGGRGLDETTTWSVAMVCAIIVVISIILEKMLHHVGHYLKERHKIGLLEALEKIKTELMVLGFISLLLTFCQSYIAAICVSKMLTKDFLPCKKKYPKPPDDDDGDGGEAENRRRLLFYTHGHRVLAGGGGPAKECKPGYEPLITVEGLHQLHIFIFFLAVFHVIYSALTMIAGRAKIREWKTWEKEILEQQAAGHDKFRLTKETSFVKGHTTNSGLSVCFFRQFFSSVKKSDYLIMRHGFISVSAYAMIWLSLFPVVILLAVGTKLQAIIAQMALEIQERHAVIQGIPLVQVTDKHFWFKDPTIILYFIQLTLFMYEFGFDSCFHVKPVLQLGRVVIGYAILPLYALMTQMGSKMKRSIFDDQTSKALKHWKKHAMKKKESKGAQSGHLPTKGLSSPSGNAQSHVVPPNADPTGSPSQSAHIVASVDIPQEKQNSSSNPHLL
ncbi:hypothetical protein L6452_04885 [Arctium lappa]|uniref:Uncharacterized protein n=1 Tax=Arctium lappa TaxID=4217 RepID=A0ACB9EEG3_ARCLA|nr:hypothetical protein L6452_04885 [Arctium lappa]